MSFAKPRTTRNAFKLLGGPEVERVTKRFVFAASARRMDTVRPPLPGPGPVAHGPAARMWLRPQLRGRSWLRAFAAAAPVISIRTHFEVEENHCWSRQGKKCILMLPNVPFRKCVFESMLSVVKIFKDFAKVADAVCFSDFSPSLKCCSCRGRVGRRRGVRAPRPAGRPGALPRDAGAVAFGPDGAAEERGGQG